MNTSDVDEQKSRANADKHGINVIAAQALWSDPYLVKIPAKTQDEPRKLVIGQISGKHWSAIYTLRGGVIRIISVRRSRKEEVTIYESSLSS